VSLPAATSIGGGAFQYCNSLSFIALPVATSFGASSFGYSTSLTSGLYINAPLAGLGDQAFYTSSITAVHLRPAPNTPAGWTTGNGQTIAGKSSIKVVFDWTTYPNLP